MSFARYLAFAGTATILLVIHAAAEPVATTRATNLRKAPGIDSEIVTLIPKGTTVEVGDCREDGAGFHGIDKTVMPSPVGKAVLQWPNVPVRLLIRREGDCRPQASRWWCRARDCA